PGEFYLRWLERFTSWQFGTKLGRLFTWYVTLPLGGGFLIAFALIRIFHLRGREPSVAEYTRSAAVEASPSVVGLVGEVAANPFPGGSVVHALNISQPTESVTRVVARTFFDWINLSLWFAFTAIIFGLLHSPWMRSGLVAGGRWLGRSLRAMFVQFP